MKVILKQIYTRSQSSHVHVGLDGRMCWPQLLPVWLQSNDDPAIHVPSWCKTDGSYIIHFYCRIGSIVFTLFVQWTPSVRNVLRLRSANNKGWELLSIKWKNTILNSAYRFNYI